MLRLAGLTAINKRVKISFRLSAQPTETSTVLRIVYQSYINDQTLQGISFDSKSQINIKLRIMLLSSSRIFSKSELGPRLNDVRISIVRPRWNNFLTSSTVVSIDRD